MLTRIYPLTEIPPEYLPPVDHNGKTPVKVEVEIKIINTSVCQYCCRGIKLTPKSQHTTHPQPLKHLVRSVDNDCLGKPVAVLTDGFVNVINWIY
jgi:hypothetical protein